MITAHTTMDGCIKVKRLESKSPCTHLQLTCPITPVLLNQPEP